MKIESLRQLSQLIALCRRQGVNIIKVDNIELVLEGTPQVAKASKSSVEAASTPTYAPGGITEETRIQTPTELTEEQLLFYSANGEQQ
jgi:hypothetical protein